VRVEDALELLLGAVPDFVTPDRLLRGAWPAPSRTLEVERIQYVRDHVHDLFDFRLDLLGADEEVAVVDREGPDPREPGEFAALFCDRPSVFRIADRQVAVAPGVILEDGGVAGTVHRLQAELVVADVEDEHVVLIVLVVTRAVPEVRLEDVGVST